eukprot:SAG31_NODE_23554_length_502_cov_0.501241_1_plen_81_part_10
MHVEQHACERFCPTKVQGVQIGAHEAANAVPDLLLIFLRQRLVVDSSVCDTIRTLLLLPWFLHSGKHAVIQITEMSDTYVH